MDPKERKKKNKKVQREAKKEEMQYFRKRLDELLNDDASDQVAFPPTLDSGQRKRLHTYAHSLGLKSKSHGKGTVQRRNILFQKSLSC